MDTPERSSSSATRVVQDVWDVYRDELGVVPQEVVLALRDAVSRSSVDDFWTIWSRNAELGLFRAFSKAGGPTGAGSSAFLSRGLLRIRSKRLGGRAVGGRGSSRLIGPVVVMMWMFIVLSTLLTPLLLLWYSFVGVLSLLRTRSRGFTQPRWGALLGFWEAVCRHGPCGPISSLDPWERWILPDLHGFYKWVFDSFEVFKWFH